MIRTAVQAPGLGVAALLVTLPFVLAVAYSVPAPAATPTATVTSGDVSRFVVEGTPIYIDVSIAPSVQLTVPLYARVANGKGVFRLPVSVRSNGQGGYTLTLTTLSTAGSGVYFGNVSVKLCTDAPCTQAQPVPSIPVTYTINVMDPASAWPGDHLNVLSAWSGVADWTQFQGNAKHTGYVPVDLNPDHLSTRWAIPAVPATGGNYSPFRSLATSGNRLYLGGGETLYARSEFDASLEWSHSFSDLTYPSVNPPAVKGGVVYVAAGQQDSTYLFAFNSVSGAQRFKSPMSSQWEHYLPPTVSPQGIYTNAGTYGGLYAFNPQGTQLHFAPMAQTSMWTPAVDATGVYSYTGGRLTVTDPVTGAERYAITDYTFTNYMYEIGGAPVLGTGTVFVANYGNSVLNGGGIGNTLIAFDLNSRSVKWRFKGNYPTTGAFQGGNLYIANENPLRLEVRAQSSGALRWSWTPPHEADSNFRSEVLLTGNLVFVSTNLATYAIDRTTHHTVWSYPASGRLAVSRNGILYIQSEDLLTAINLK